MNRIQEQPELLTVKETAQYLKVSELTILRLAHRGRLAGIRVGRQWRFSLRSIVRLVDGAGTDHKKQRSEIR